jgi:hypothetical protein
MLAVEMVLCKRFFIFYFILFYFYFLFFIFIFILFYFIFILFLFLFIKNTKNTKNTIQNNKINSYPNHATAIYSSQTSGSNVTLRWDLNSTICNAVDRRYGSTVLLVNTGGYQEKIQALNQYFVTRNFDSLDESVYSWSVFTECWRRAKRFILGSDVSYDPSSTQPSGFTTSTDKCWSIDKLSSNRASDTDKCYRSFVYCKKQNPTSNKTKNKKTKQKNKKTKKQKNKTKQNKTKQNKTKQNKTKQNKTTQNKTKQNKTKQNKTKQNKTKQNKTKQNKTKN